MTLLNLIFKIDSLSFPALFCNDRGNFKIAKQCGYVIENKGQARKRWWSSGNVVENKGS
jgi:hypothetical protein